MSASKKTIIVSLTEEGCTVQFPFGIDPGTLVEIRDYNVPEEWEGDIQEDEDGDRYERQIFEPTDIKDVIRRHRASLHPRDVGGGPSYEWDGLATPELIADLEAAGYSFDRFTANVKEHPDYGKACVLFTTFGIKLEDVPEEPNEH